MSQKEQKDKKHRNFSNKNKYGEIFPILNQNERCFFLFLFEKRKDFLKKYLPAFDKAVFPLYNKSREIRTEQKILCKKTEQEGSYADNESP